VSDIGDRIGDALDHLTAYPRAEESQFVPRTEFDYAAGGFIQTGPMLEQPTNYDDLLRQFGYDPAEVCIVGHPKVSRWQQRARIRGTAEYETTWLSAFKFTIAARQHAAAPADLEAIVKAVKKTPRSGAGPRPHTFVFQASDLQCGKVGKTPDGGPSTPHIARRYLEAVAAAADEFKHLKRLGIEAIQISMPGDLIEGSESQNKRNLGYLTETGVPEQTRVLRRLMMATVETFAPLCDTVYLDVVGGNHDDADRALNIWPGNNWAVETATIIADALTLNPDAFRHVTVRVPDRWQGHMTVPVGVDNPTVVTVAHGHQWRRNRGMDWWAGQAHGGHPAGAAHILQCGHYHGWHIESSATKTLIQSPTFDLGSAWYTERTGATSRRGGLVYLLNAGDVSRMTVV
jgi:hypothetical protein